MQVSEITYASAQPVEGYGPGFFRIAGEVIRGPMLVTATTRTGWDGLDDADPLAALAGAIDVLLIGMGAEMALAPRSLRDALEADGIGVEAMATPTACRTYNVLLAEDRRVALAALPV